MGLLDFNFQETMMRLLGLLIGLTVHEYSHGWAADRLGDPTARLSGRLTLNPFAHLDPFGTLMIIFAPFGWAKPVPVNPYNLRSPKRDMVTVSLAGPLANLGTAILFGIAFRIAVAVSIRMGAPLGLTLSVLYVITLVNVALAFFNLLPIPPLDGSHILGGLLPPRYDHIMQWLNRYGFILLIVLIATRVLGTVLGFFIGPVLHMLTGI